VLVEKLGELPQKHKQTVATEARLKDFQDMLRKSRKLPSFQAQCPLSIDQQFNGHSSRLPVRKLSVPSFVGMA
jgi:hypothetical protein